MRTASGYEAALAALATRIISPDAASYAAGRVQRLACRRWCETCQKKCKNKPHTRLHTTDMYARTCAAAAASTTRRRIGVMSAGSSSL